MENKSYEEDFRIIWAAIDGAKNPIDKLGQFFKNYAMINIIIVALNLIVNLYQGLAMEIYIVKMIIKSLPVYSTLTGKLLYRDFWKGAFF